MSVRRASARWRRLARVLRWRLDRAARGRWALAALFGGSIIESSLLPWPIEFPLLAYMLRGRRQLVEATCLVALGSALGCLLTYFAGRAAYEAFAAYIYARPDLAEGLAAARVQIDAWGGLAVVFAMVSPVPVQLASLAAGAAQMSVGVFFVAALAGRMIRYWAMGALVFVFGARILGAWRRLPRRVRLGVAGLAGLAFAALFVWGVVRLALPGS